MGLNKNILLGGLGQKPIKTPHLFSESSTCFTFIQSLTRVNSRLLYMNAKLWHDVPLGKQIRR